MVGCTKVIGLFNKGITDSDAKATTTASILDGDYSNTDLDEDEIEEGNQPRPPLL